MNAFAKVDKQSFFRFAAEHAEQRYELVRGRIVEQMNGGTKRHGQVAMRVAGQLMDQLDEASWSIIVDRGVETPQSVRYPDVVVEPADEAGDSVATSRPALIVEVLSPSTTATDLDVKPEEYFALSSLDAYIVASQDEAACMVWVRGADGRFGSPQEFRGAAATISIKVRGSIDGRGPTLVLPLAKIYR